MQPGQGAHPDFVPGLALPCRSQPNGSIAIGAPLEQVPRRVVRSRYGGLAENPVSNPDHITVLDSIHRCIIPFEPLAGVLAQHDIAQPDTLRAHVENSVAGNAQELIPIKLSPSRIAPPPGRYSPRPPATDVLDVIAPTVGQRCGRARSERNGRRSAASTGSPEPARPGGPCVLLRGHTHRQQWPTDSRLPLPQDGGR